MGQFIAAKAAKVDDVKVALNKEDLIKVLQSIHSVKDLNEEKKELDEIEFWTLWVKNDLRPLFICIYIITSVHQHTTKKLIADMNWLQSAPVQRHSGYMIPVYL